MTKSVTKIERQRAWREAHREEVRAYQRAWREANREKERESARAYREAHREARLEYTRAWHEQHHAEALAYNRTTKHGITRERRDFIYDLNEGRCYGCQKPMANDDLEVDHDHSCCPGEYSCGKCVRGLLCHRCNTRDVLAAA